MRILSILVAFSALLLAATPAAAAPNDWGNNGRDRGWGQRNGTQQNPHHNQQDNDNHDNDNHGNDINDNDDHGWGQRGGWGGGWGGGWNGGWNGRRIHSDWELDEDEAKALSDELQDCVSTGHLRDLHWWRLRELIQSIGLTKREWQQVDNRRELSDALANKLEVDDLQDLRMAEILRVAHACGLSKWDVIHILRES